MLKQEFPLKNGRTTFRLVNQKSDPHDWKIANHTKMPADSPNKLHSKNCVLTAV